MQPSPSFFDKGGVQPSKVGTDNEIQPETTPPVKRLICSKPRMAAFVYPEVIEPPSDDDSGPEGNLIVPDAAEAPVVRTKRADSKDTSSTADQRRGRTSTSAAVVAGNPRFTWDVSEDHSPPAAVPLPTPKSVGSN